MARAPLCTCFYSYTNVVCSCKEGGYLGYSFDSHLQRLRTLWATTKPWVGCRQMHTDDTIRQCRLLVYIRGCPILPARPS